MDNLFKVRVLTLAVNKLKPVKTTVLDRVYRRKEGQISDLLAFDIISGSEAILSNVSVYAPATVTTKTNRKVVTLQAPRFPTKRHIAAGELNAMRAFGTQASVELLANRIRQEQSDMRMEVDRTREFMAVQALKGQVVDGSGTVLVDFNFTDAQKPTTVSGIDAGWDEETGDPVKDIRAWKKYISDRVPMVEEWLAYCGSSAMDALINNDNAREMLKYTAGQDIAREGRIARLAGVDIDEYFGSYLDADGARQDMIGEDEFILVGWSTDSFSEQYAPVVDLDSESGVGSGMVGQMFFAKSWKTEDPSGRWLKTEARPLPVVHRPEAIIYAKVIAGE